MNMFFFRFSVIAIFCLTLVHGLLNEKIHEIEHVAKVLRGNRTYLPFKEVPYLDMDRVMNNQSVFFTSFPLTLNQMGNRICWYFEVGFLTALNVLPKYVLLIRLWRVLISPDII